MKSGNSVGKKKLGIGGGGMFLTRAVVVCLVVLLVGSMLGVYQVHSEPSTRGAKLIQTARGRCDNNASYPGVRMFYINNSGVGGYVAYWTNHAHDQTVHYGANVSYLYTTYTRWDVALDTLWPTWPGSQPFSFVYVNATGYCAYTFTPNAKTDTPITMPNTYVTKIPQPTGTVAGSEATLTWPAWENSMDLGSAVNCDPPTSSNGEFKGYLLYRGVNNATWNDNSSAGPVVSPNDWVLVNGTVASPLTGTSCTDTPPGAGTYYYSLKLVFNGSAYVETMWGGQGSNPATIVGENNAPTLSNGAVNPTEGDTATGFNFTVKYNDSDNNAPAANIQK